MRQLWPMAGSPDPRQGVIKCMLCWLPLATFPFRIVLEMPRSRRTPNVIPVYRHLLPNLPGKSIKGGGCWL